MADLANLLTLTDDAHGVLVLRVARKTHPCRCRCQIEHPGQEVCVETIDPGLQYLESFSETPAYQSGDRYCPPCAVTCSWARAGHVRYAAATTGSIGG